MIECQAEIVKDDKTEGIGLRLPINIKEIFGAARARLRGTIAGHPFKATAMPYSGIYYIGIPDSYSAAARKKIGTSVKVKMELDPEARTFDMPSAFQTALDENHDAKIAYDRMSFTHRKEWALWIAAAKKEETTQRRIDTAISKLLEGKK